MRYQIPWTTLQQLVGLSMFYPAELAGAFTPTGQDDVYDNALQVEPRDRHGDTTRVRDARGQEGTVFVGRDLEAVPVRNTEGLVVFHTHPEATYRRLQAERFETIYGYELTADCPSVEDFDLLPQIPLQVMLSFKGVWVYQYTLRMRDWLGVQGPDERARVVARLHDALVRIHALRWQSNPPYATGMVTEELADEAMARAYDLYRQFNELMLSDIDPGLPALPVYDVALYPPRRDRWGVWSFYPYTGYLRIEVREEYEMEVD